MKKVFPELEFVELPYSHPIYHQKYQFPKGLPKVHEHEGKRAQGFGLLHKGRLVCFYSYECDLGNGWERHRHLPRRFARHARCRATDGSQSGELRPDAVVIVGANLVSYALTQL